MSAMLRYPNMYTISIIRIVRVTLSTHITGNNMFIRYNNNMKL